MARHRHCSTLLLAAAAAFQAAHAQVLLEDRCDTGLSPEWKTVKGTAWVQDGWMYLQDLSTPYFTPRDALTAVHDGDTFWTDYEMRARVEPMLTNSPEVWKRATILLRTDNLSYADYGPGLNANLYGLTFIEPGDGASPGITFGRQNGQVWTPLAAVPSAPAGAFDLLARVVGDRITVEVDGTTVMDVTDPQPLGFGGAGVFTIWESLARFDNFLITVPALFEDHFYSGLKPDWRVIKGSAWESGGRLFLQDQTEPAEVPRDSVVVTHDGDVSWTDYEMRVKVIPTVTPIMDRWVRAALLLRTSGTTYADYNVGPEFEGYFVSFILPGDPGQPQLTLYRKMQGSPGVLLAATTTGIPAGEFNVTARVIGPRVTVDINGVTALDVWDPEGPTHGGVGLFNIWESLGQYDDVIVLPIPPNNPCYADFNQDGGIDGADVEAFFIAWEASDVIADVNQDGGVDGSDVETFFGAWEAGGC
ncbi:MAG: hypothetical protein JSR77_03800 [Planctomycetes bacterium]|nr:hypothetical protein [Planctomycetota bacterium]